MNTNSPNLRSALDWVGQVVAGSLAVHFNVAETFDAPPFTYLEDDSWLARLVQQENPSAEEFAIFMMALAPHLEPNFFGRLIAAHLPEGGDFAEFGGVRGIGHRGFLPTGETVLFVLAGADLEKRLAVQQFLDSRQWLARSRMVRLAPVPEGEPAMSGRLVMDSDLIDQITLGTITHPQFSAEFPAEHLETQMEWDDLVLHPATLTQIREIESWIRHHNTVLNDWGMRKRIRRGYRALFCGPPGTGKTLTATLLGKHTGKDVFRIDLSRLVSKYIGETEKNLCRLFDKAENKNWILFFDEADALFGKRTEVRDAHDKYANQEVAYLLQRIECYEGLVILATNQRANIDEAFVRRLQNIVHFPMPSAAERYDLWRKTFPPQIAIAEDIDWHYIAARHELTGASILNVTQFCAVDVLARQSLCLDLQHLETAIQREYIKEGKIV